MRRIFPALILAVIVVLALPMTAHAASVSVSVLGSDTLGDGSIAKPYATIQHAIDMAATGDVVSVGTGTFSGDVMMKNGVSLYGSGPATIIEGTGADSALTASGIGGGETVWGLSITGGDAFEGGGIYCSASSPTIMLCSIVGNTAFMGGGIYCDALSFPLILNNSINSNFASGLGGGIYCASDGAVIRGNSIVDNAVSVGEVSGSGGGIYCDGASPTIEHNTISSNDAGLGGGIYCGSLSWPKIVGNVISENNAHSGAGIYSYGSSSDVVNNTVVDNTASVLGGGVCRESVGTLRIVNCILWGNGDDLYGCAATYSDIEDGDVGTGNVSADPMFVDRANGDYRLRSDSPCINRANSAEPLPPSIDIRGVARPQGTSHDMGAHEYEGPLDPHVSSPTHTVAAWSAEQTVTIVLTETSETVAPAAGYAISVGSLGSPSPVVTHGAETTSCVLFVPSGRDSYVNLATVDADGNWSNGTSFGPIYVDTTAPVTTAVTMPSSAISLSAMDPFSGVALTEWSLDGAEWVEGTRVTPSEPGVYTLRFHSVDAVGNNEAISTMEFDYQPYRYVSLLGSDAIGDGTLENPYATPQHAIDMAVAGQTVCVGPGTFTGNVTMKNGVSLIGSGANETILNGTGSDSVVRFSNLYTDELLSDLTVTGGSATDGGGIYCNASSPTISNVIVTGNTAASKGAGIYCGAASSAVIVNTVVSDNMQTAFRQPSTGGTAIFCSSSSPKILNCTVVDNECRDLRYTLPGAIQSDSLLPTIENCIIWGNMGAGLKLCTATYSDNQDGAAGIGNISIDPRFVSSVIGEYQLRADSPCIDVANPVTAPASDIRGAYRPQGAGSDMGAFEYYDAASASPIDPMLSSATHSAGVWSSSTSVAVELTDARGTVAPVAGFAISVSTEATAPGEVLSRGATTASYAFTAPASGTYYVNVATVDELGNWSEGVHFGPILIDTLAPVDPFLSSASHLVGAWSREGTATLTLAGASDADGSGVAGYSIEWTQDATAVPEPVISHGVETSMTVTGLASDGTWYARVRTVDAAGNWSGGSELGPILVDRAAPVISATPTATVVIDGVTISLHATDALSGVGAVYCAVDGASGVATDTVRLDSVGDHVIEFWAVDVAGNESVHGSRSVRVSPSETAHLGIAGDTRYATAAAVSRRSFPNGANTVIVATGENWPDALGGAALAGAHDAPVLLTGPKWLSADAAVEIKRLKPQHVIILGGVGVVSEDVAVQLRGLAVHGADIERLSGSDRYATSEAIAARVVSDSRLFDGTAFVTTGVSFPDALAAAPLAAALERPLYLAGPHGLSAETLSEMKQAGVSDVVILGGVKAVSEVVPDQLDAASIDYMRISGIDRYATALEIAKQGVAEGLTWNKLAFACGTDFPDALAGGVMQGHDSSVMVLTECDSLDVGVRTALVEQRDIIGEVRYIGGLRAIDQSVRDAVKQLLR